MKRLLVILILPRLAQGSGLILPVSSNATPRTRERELHAALFDPFRLQDEKGLILARSTIFKVLTLPWKLRYNMSRRKYDAIAQYSVTKIHFFFHIIFRLPSYGRAVTSSASSCPAEKAFQLNSSSIQFRARLLSSARPSIATWRQSSSLETVSTRLAAGRRFDSFVCNSGSRLQAVLTVSHIHFVENKIVEDASIQTEHPPYRTSCISSYNALLLMQV